MGKKVYLASSFANADRHETELRKNTMKHISELLQSRFEFEVYNPSSLNIPNAWDYTMQEWGLMVFTCDITHIDECDIVIYLSYGKQNNAGSAFECGYSFAKGKKVIIVSMTNDTESLMLLHGSYAQVKGENGLLTYDFTTMPKSRIVIKES